MVGSTSFLVRVPDGDFFFFRGRSGVVYSDLFRKGAVPIFWRRQNEKLLVFAPNKKRAESCKRCSRE